MQPLMVFFWRSSCGWMKCPQIRACSGSGVAETKSRRKRDRAAGARGQGAEPDQASCVRDFPNASHRLIPCFVEGASPPSPGSSCEVESDSGQWSVFSSKARAPGATFRESVAATFVRDSPGETARQTSGSGHTWNSQSGGDDGRAPRTEKHPPLHTRSGE